MSAPCKIDACDRPVRRNEMCNAHDLRAKRGTDMHAPIRTQLRGDAKPETCTREECDGDHYASGLCRLHYYRQYEGRDMDAPRRYAPRVSGESHRTTAQGYRQLWMPEHPGADERGYVNEHRVVMERLVGRYLLPNENVHHKNGVRDDNDPGNLELWVKKQPIGQRPEDLVAYARQVLARYGDSTEREQYADHF